MRTRCVFVAGVLILLAGGCAGGGEATRTDPLRASPAPTSAPLLPGTSTSGTTPGGTGAGAENSSDVYAVRLVPVNGSGVSGRARVRVRGDSVSVSIEAEGLLPGRKHPQHLHGFRNGDPSVMPSRREGLSDSRSEAHIGPVLLALEPYPVPTGDSVAFRRDYGDVLSVFPLDIRAIELHGMMKDGEYDFSLPVAVGLLQPSGRAVPRTPPPSGPATVSP